jgi:hypothetical protein
MKYEWRKHDKKTYLPKKIDILEIESMQYIILEGEGNPNSDSFTECIEALYALSYGIRMSPKKGIETKGYYEYTVFPLQGIWDLTDKGKELYTDCESIIDIKDELAYKIMIRQPEFVTQKEKES